VVKAVYQLKSLPPLKVPFQDKAQSQLRCKVNYLLFKIKPKDLLLLRRPGAGSYQIR
jgi:hypothetical protein